MQRPVGDTELRAYSTLAGVLFPVRAGTILTFRWATLATIIIPIYIKEENFASQRLNLDPPYTSKGLELCDWENSTTPFSI